ncbi:MAG TPA: methyltransferase [Rhodanobacteraceae bacterium]|nr:methyltransferase [Rhodanobacteraceae bacterium]
MSTPRMHTIVGITLGALLLAGCQPNDAPISPAAAASVPAAADSGIEPPLDQPEQVTPPRSASDMLADQLAPIVDGAWRSVSHKARDRYRHPRATLAFFGVRSDMTLIEITPGGGWYTELLAPLVNDDGQYIAAIARSRKSGDEPAGAAKAVQALISGWPEHFANARVVRFDPAAPVFGPPGQADAVLTFRNAHNWVAAGTAPAMFKAFYAALRPGGILGLTDHRAAPGETLAQAKGTGYLPQDYVVKLATDAGFKLDATSDINANPKDTRHHPKGVWTLPPTLALGTTDREKYLAIGESDRMTLRFVKPAEGAAPAAAASTH